MKTLLIDDQRMFEVTETARDYAEAISVLERGESWDIVYLDHDLGDGPTGYDAILHIEHRKDSIGLPKKIICISANPAGRDKIDAKIIELYGHLFEDFYAHPTSIIDDGAQIGSGTKIWHFAHIRGGAQIGRHCNIGQNVYIADIKIGSGCKIQNNVSLYDGVEVGNNVFIGPSAVTTNDGHPRATSTIQKEDYSKTFIKDNASICANATLVSRPGRTLTIGEFAMVGAGSVVVEDVPPFAVVIGNPARIIKYLSEG